MRIKIAGSRRPRMNNSKSNIYGPAGRTISAQEEGLRPRVMSAVRDVSDVAKALGLVGGASALAYGAAKRIKRKMYSKRKGFQDVQRIGGHEFESLTPEEKRLAEHYYKQLAQHSPTVASDPVASWNQIRSLLNTPTSYGPQTIESWRKIEASGPQGLRL